MTPLTPHNKKHLETAAYCINAMLSGEELSMGINPSACESIECLDELNDAIQKGFEITFEGGNQQKRLDFATLSDKAKDALQMLWRSPLAGVVHKKGDLRRKYGEETFNELDNLLKR